MPDAIDTTNSREATSYDVTVDQSGNWVVTTTKKIISGGHSVEAISDKGMEDSALLYIPEETTEQGASAGSQIFMVMKSGISFIYWLVILLLALVVLLLLLRNLRLYIQEKKLIEKLKSFAGQALSTPRVLASKSIEKIRTIKLIRIGTILLVSIIVVISSFIIYSCLRPAKKAEPVIYHISGSVYKPFSIEGVPGVDLTFGDTNIRTVPSGKYNFSLSGNKLDTIRLTYPGLTKVVIKKIENIEHQNLYFDLNLYNTLTYITDLESRGQIGLVYDNFLDNEIKKLIDRQTFIDNWQSIFGSDDVMDQELVVREIIAMDPFNSTKFSAKFAKTMKIVLENNVNIKNYYLRQTNEGWKMVY